MIEENKDLPKNISDDQLIEVSGGIDVYNAISIREKKTIASITRDGKKITSQGLENLTPEQRAIFAKRLPSDVRKKVGL